MSILRVKEIIKQKGITGRDIAFRIGMTEVGFYKAISEKGNPPLRRLQEISNAIGVPISELFENTKKDDVVVYNVIKCPHCKKLINIELK